MRRIEDARALDLLLLRGEDRTVQKKGIRIEGAWFYDDALLDLMGTGETVEVRLNPEDMGKAYVYRADPHEFLCEARNLDRLGLERGEIAARARAVQRQRMTEARKAVRAAARPVKPGEAVDMVLQDAEARNSGCPTAALHEGRNSGCPTAALHEGRNSGCPTAALHEGRNSGCPTAALHEPRHAAAAASNNVVPLRPVAKPDPVSHTSPALEAAAEAARVGQPPKPSALTPAQQAINERIRADLQASPSPVVETPLDRFRRILALQKRIKAGQTPDFGDVKWMNRYQSTPEYRGLLRMYEDFGDRMLMEE